MKSIKLFLAVATITAICASSVFAGDTDKSGSDKQEHKCCAEAKAAGKTCDKCSHKEDAKKDEAKK